MRIELRHDAPQASLFALRVSTPPEKVIRHALLLSVPAGPTKQALGPDRRFIGQSDNLFTGRSGVYFLLAVMDLTQLSNLLGNSIQSTEGRSLFQAFPLLQPSIQDLAPDENLPAEYYLTDASSGIQLRHSSEGEIEVIFLMSKGKDGFAQYDRALGNQITFSSAPADIARQLGEPSKTAPARTIPLLGKIGETMRYDYPGHSIHFQFAAAGNGIEQVTLSIPSATPGRSG